MRILSNFYKLITLDMSGKEISFENIAEELNKENFIEGGATSEIIADLYSEGIIAIRDDYVYVLIHRY